MNNNLNLDALNNLSPAERAYALQILEEMSKGKMDSYHDLLSADYKEIPVDIETFLKDPQYLGKGLHTEEGKFTVFPYWVETLKKLFPNNFDTAYNTLVLTGGIGLGKSLVAVLAMAYMLYRMLCLKNPYVFYGLQEIDHITFSFLNITMDAAKGVAWSKFQELVQLSPWFKAHGRISKSLNPEWQPIIDKGEIELLYGSQQRHVIGRAVFCLDGKTEIYTDNGVFALENIVNKPIRVYTLDENNNIILSDECKVVPTIISNEEYEIELEDGSIIKCTPNHRLMLKDGTYKEAKDLTEEDELMDFTNILSTSKGFELDDFLESHTKEEFEHFYITHTISDTLYHFNLSNVLEINFLKLAYGIGSTSLDELPDFNPVGYIYKIHNTVTNKIYIGKRQKNHFDNAYWGSGDHIKSSIAQYGKESFERSILEWCKTKKELCDREKFWIEKFDARNPEKGYNIAVGGDGIGIPHTDEWKIAHSGTGNGRYGKEVSEETRQKISNALKGKYKGIKNPKKGRPGQKKPDGFGEKIAEFRKGKKHSDETKQRILDSTKESRLSYIGSHIYNNGEVELRVREGETAPEGFTRGRLKRYCDYAKANCTLPRNYRWYNNGEVEIYTDKIPNGFVKGRLKGRKRGSKNENITN